VPVEVETQAMGTRLRVLAWADRDLQEQQLRGLIALAIEEFRRIETLMSPRLPDSDVSRINALSGSTVTVSQDTFRVLQQSLWAGETSSGAFDITFASLAELWKFGDAAGPIPRPPDSSVVAQRLGLVDYRRVQLGPEPLQVKIPGGVAIGLGGIAKGYAVDRAAAVLRAKGVNNFVLQAGGDMLASGSGPERKRWRTAIQDPRGAGQSSFATMELQDIALTTAGDYERFYFWEGRRYHHIIDPRTGYPATACRSVSITAPQAWVADALDDAVFILGPARGLEMVESVPEAGALVVDEHNQVWVSQRLQGKVQLDRPPSP
jgi:thiamine biosynthesis lipoprotein